MCQVLQSVGVNIRGSPGHPAMVGMQRVKLSGPPLHLLVSLSLLPWLIVLPLSSKYMAQLWFPLHAILSSGFAFWVSLLGDPHDCSRLCQMTGIIPSQNLHPVVSAMPSTPTTRDNENLNIHSCVKYVTL